MILWVGSANTTERALMVAALAEEGYAARGFESFTELMAALARGEPPCVLVVDAESIDLRNENWETVERLALSAKTILIAGSMAAPSPPIES